MGLYPDIPHMIPTITYENYNCNAWVFFHQTMKTLNGCTSISGSHSIFQLLNIDIFLLRNERQCFRIVGKVTRKNMSEPSQYYFQIIKLAMNGVVYTFGRFLHHNDTRGYYHWR